MTNSMNSSVGELSVGEPDGPADPDPVDAAVLDGSPAGLLTEVG